MNRELEEKIKPYLKPSRYAHTIRCRDMALRLCRRWGGDAVKTEQAALLHDITKKLTDEEQLQLCRRYGIINKYSGEGFSFLIHADTAAALAADIFKMPDDVCRAIKLHTLGGIDMSLLEKIIYLADAIEDGRDYPGVEEIRDVAFKDLDRAVLMSLEGTIANVREQGREPDSQSVRAAEYLRKTVK